MTLTSPNLDLHLTLNFRLCDLEYNILYLTISPFGFKITKNVAKIFSSWSTNLDFQHLELLQLVIFKLRSSISWVARFFILSQQQSSLLIFDIWNTWNSYLLQTSNLFQKHLLNLLLMINPLLTSISPFFYELWGS